MVPKLEIKIEKYNRNALALIKHFVTRLTSLTNTIRQQQKSNQEASQIGNDP